MNAYNFEIADFFKQLSLLTRSELPLPDSLRQMGLDARSRRIRAIINQLADSTETGKPLSEALGEQPDLFPPLYIKIVALGEKEGTLPQVLHELARIARLYYVLASMFKDIMVYPLFTSAFAALLFLVLSCLVIPIFKSIFDELLAGEPLPGLTNMIISMSMFIREHIFFFSGVYIILIIFIFWLYSNTRMANKTLLPLIRNLPFSEVIFYNFAMARLCSVWAAMMRRQVPVEEAFPVIAATMDFPCLSSSLNRITAKIKDGEDIKACLAGDPNISRLLVMTVDNSPENKLPDELDKLSDLFRERGYYGYRRVGVGWEVVSTTCMSCFVGLVILFFFLPFIGRILSGW